MSKKRLIFIVNFNDQYQIDYNYTESFLTSFDLSVQIVNNYVYRSQIVIVTMLWYLKFINDDKY